MTEADRAHLIKLLGMTGSAGDGEAMNALRLAVKFMAERKLTWNDVLARAGDAPAVMHGLVDEAWRMATKRDTGADPELQEIAVARVRLDEIMKVLKPGRAKHAHFEAILHNHQGTGWINPTHRQQIERAFHSMPGWDRPVGGNKVETVVVDEIGLTRKIKGAGA